MASTYALSIKFSALARSSTLGETGGLAESPPRLVSALIVIEPSLGETRPVVTVSPLSLEHRCLDFLGMHSTFR